MTDPRDTDRASLPLSGEELFRAFVETTDALTYVLDLSRRHGPPVYISPQVESILGRRADELDTWTPGALEVAHPDDREGLAAAAGRTIDDGVMFDEEFRVLRPDGSTRWLRDRAHVLPARDGRPSMWLGFAIDVTARRERQERAHVDAEHHRHLVEQLPGIVFRLANEPPFQRVTYLSPQIEDVFGYPVEQWIHDASLWTRAIHPDDREKVDAGWAAAVGAEQPFVAEYRVVRNDGRTVWVRETTTPVRRDDGRVDEWQGFMLDVTATKEAEAALGTTYARYQALVEQLPAVVYVDSDDADPVSIYVSSASAEILGYPPEAYVRDRSLWPRTMHPDERDRVLAAWRAAVQTGEPFDIEYRFVRPDGTDVWVRDTSIRIEGDDGERTWQGVILDVTRRVLAEKEASATAARYQALVEGIPAAVYEMGPDDERRTLYVGPQIEELLGYSRSEWLDQPDIWIELLHPDDREFELAAHDLHNETGEPWRRDYRMIASDGRIVWVRDQAVLVRDAEGRARTWQGVLLDVTAQKEAEEQLRRANDELEFRVTARTSQLAEANELMALEIGERRRMEEELRHAEERYRRLVEDIPAVIYIWQTRDWETTDASYVSPQIEQVLGFTPTEWHERNGFWRERLHPHDRDAVIAATERTERTGEPFHQEFRYLAKDGRIVWVLESASLLSRDAEGRPFILQGVMLDITARKRAEAKAAAAEERYRELAEAAPAISYVFERDHAGDGKTTLHYVSPQIAEVLGYPVSRWMDDPDGWIDVVHPDDRDLVEATTAASYGTGAPWAIDYRVLAADGRIVWLHSRARCTARDEQGRPWRFVGVVLEVTEHQDADRRVRDDLAAATALIEGMPGVPWTEVVDPETGWQRYVYIGPQSKEIFGYDPVELIAEPGHFDRMVHPDDLQRVLARSERADQLDQPWVDEYRAIHRDGSIRWVHATGRRVTAEGVSPAVWHGVTVDVTDERRPREASEGRTIRSGRRRR